MQIYEQYKATSTGILSDNKKKRKKEEAINWDIQRCLLKNKKNLGGEVENPLKYWFWLKKKRGL